MYLVLGCGIVGYAIAESLRQRGKEPIIVEMDADRAKELAEMDFNVIEEDFFSASTQVRRNVERSDVMFFVSTDIGLNKRALKYVRSINPEAYTIVRGMDNQDVEDLKKDGAGAVIIPQAALAELALKKLNDAERHERMLNLSRRIPKGGRVAIVMHDNPDPDAIASSMALKMIVEHLGATADIAYGGEIGHQKNKVFVNILDVDLLHIDEYNKYLLRGYDIIAFVDHSSESTTSILPLDTTPDIIIDHHQSTLDYPDSFKDIRSSIGAVSTMMCEYLDDFEIPVDSDMATALVYGIMTDTNMLKRGISKEDVSAISQLQPLLDQEKLSQFENPSIEPEVMDVIGKSIMGREVVSGYIFSNIGHISNRDSLPQAADYLLNLEGVNTVLVFGILNDSLHISARTKDIKLNLGQAMDKAFSDIGSAGGHVSSAGARIPLGIFGIIDDKEILKNLAGEAIKKKFLKTVGVL